MPKKKEQQTVFKIVLDLPQGGNRVVVAKGRTLEVAERRALKFNPDAIGVKRG